ncbi:YxiJ family protein [Bacillus cereus]|nr:YxiJ family protein [Bacillus cereus]
MELRQKLEYLKEALEIPYPSEDIERIEEEYKTGSFIDDFYSYTSLIDGSLSYVLSSKKIPKLQRELLYKSFLQAYPEYLFIGNLEQYVELNRQLSIYEQTRKLLIVIIEEY